jgi:hypothetical protein
MSEINTTSINDLPTDPSAGGSVGGNVNLVINETNGLNNSMQPPQMQPQNNIGSGLSLDQSTISQIVNGLQQASLAGATTLPSRDIPLHTEQLTQDPQIQPNYVPSPQNIDYINEMDPDMNPYYRKEKLENSLDNIYDELQAPLLLAVLYFLFQLPFFKKTIFQYLPFLCHIDGNYNFNGLLFVCALFGFIYYILSKSVRHFSKF